MLIRINGPNQDPRRFTSGLEAKYCTFSTAIVGVLILQTPHRVGGRLLLNFQTIGA